MTGPATAAQPGKRERTRQALIDAAIEVLAARGLEATSIDDLMRSAGMARGTFYNYFQTRDDVVRAVAQFIHDAIAQHILAKVPADYDNEAMIACAIYGFLRFGLRRPAIGWTLVRLGGASSWISSNKRGCIDEALQSLLGEEDFLAVGVTYVEGVLLMLLRRLLEQRITLAEAERTLGLTLRGLGAKPGKTKEALKLARAFADNIEAPG